MILKKIKKKIINYRKIKYQNILFTKKEILLRKEAIQFIKKTGTKSKKMKNFVYLVYTIKNI